MTVETTASAPFAELVKSYQEYQQSRGLRSVRRVGYKLAVYGRWLGGGGLDVREVGPRLAEDYQGWLTSLEGPQGPHYATRSVASMVCACESFHRWLAETEVSPYNPFHRLRRVKIGQGLPRAVLSIADLAEKLALVREFWKAATHRERKGLYRLHVMAELMYSTGMRLNELATLKVADINWEAGVVHIREGKGGVAREAYLNEYACRVLEIYVQELRPLLIKGASPLLFGVNGGKNLNTVINGAMRKHFGLTSHSLRHCLGTHLLARGCDLRFIQLILGHEDLNSTSLYTRVSKEDLRGQLDKHHPRGG